MFSAPQKRLCEGQVLGDADDGRCWQPAASVLNLRTDVAQTPVSIDGKILRMIFFPRIP